MSSHVLLAGSCREHPAGSLHAGYPALDEIVELTLILRRRNAAPEPDAFAVPLSHDQLAELHGADPADIQAIKEFVYAHHWPIVSINEAARSVTISGWLGDLAAAFCADVSLRRVGNQVFRTRQGDLHVPAALDGRIVSIFGFDERPIAAAYHTFQPRESQSISYTPLEVARLYNFPENTGAGQTIALIELGGGFKESDLEAYWRQLGLDNVSVSAVPVGRGQNRPTGNPDGPDGEVVLDIEVAGAVAPAANIAVYFAPNTDQGFLHAIHAAIHDTVRKPSVISISWGSAEREWNPQTLDAFHAAFHDAALLGITVCAAAGDNGSSDGETDGQAHVDFPASSPWVLACGGTRLIASAGQIESETVWNDGANGGATGGGVSEHFARPKYQADANVPAPQGTVNKTGRGVPDVAGVADPETGYQILVDGQQGVVGGTSAVAPLWAGLIALLNQQLGKNLGWFHPKLYGVLAQHKALRDITVGRNGAYSARIGWDPCTGLGSPNGRAILNVLK
jgi:kumamolisin